jgi:hypothetical protein
MVILRRRRVPELRNGPLGKLRGRNFPESNEATRLICVNLRQSASTSPRRISGMRLVCFSVSSVSLW